MSETARLDPTVYCPTCGAPTVATSSTCAQCGAPLRGGATPAPGPEPLATPVMSDSARCQHHPDRAATATCRRCGTFVCEACVDATSGQCTSCQGLTGTLPWDQREQLGVWVAWWRTAWAMTSQPNTTLRAAHGPAPLSGSFLFAMMSAMAGVLPTIGLYALIFVPLGLMGGLDPELKGFSPALVPVVVVVYVVLIALAQAGSFFINSGLDHLGLKLFGANPQPFETTARAQALAMGPYLVGLVPLCGLYIFPIWSLVLRIMALSELHRTTGGKAAAAVLVPLVTLCGLCGGGYVLLLAVAFAGFGKS